MLFCSCKFDEQLTIEEPFQLHAGLFLTFLQMIANKGKQCKYNVQNLRFFLYLQNYSVHIEMQFGN